MAYYRRMGEVPPKRHTQFRRPESEGGGLYSEELMGEEGFSSDSALLYHRHLPTAIVDAVDVSTENAIGSSLMSATALNAPLLPRHYRTHSMAFGDNVVTGRRLLLGNDQVRMSFAQATVASPLYRNGMGDELVYVEEGAGTLETVFGSLEVSAGDYVVIPSSTTHRWVPRGQLRALIIEARGHITLPSRYLSEHGQLLEHAPFCERDLRGPEELLMSEQTDVEVLVRHRGGVTRYTYAHHPFDVVGWDGCLYPYAFSIHDFEPITGRLHQPPPVHQTFAGPGFVICSFVPRLFDYHPLSIPAPYNHANVDSDEVLFYVGGDFMSRKGAGIEMGSITLHPGGFIHGPQPGSVEASIGKTATDELAVMLDTFKPLEIATDASHCEDPAYAWTWSGRKT